VFCVTRCPFGPPDGQSILVHLRFALDAALSELQRDDRQLHQHDPSTNFAEHHPGSSDVRTTWPNLTAAFWEAPKLAFREALAEATQPRSPQSLAPAVPANLARIDVGSSTSRPVPRRPTVRSRVVFLNLERVAVGAPEWDLVHTAIRYRSFGWIDLSEYQAFHTAYGHDVTN